MNEKLNKFLIEYNLTEFDFELIIQDISRFSPQMNLLLSTYLYGWKSAPIKVLERIIDIYNSSQVDFKNKKIIKINYD